MWQKHTVAGKSLLFKAPAGLVQQHFPSFKGKAFLYINLHDLQSVDAGSQPAAVSEGSGDSADESKKK